MAIDAVLFDCDGVLVDSEVVGLEDSAEFLREQGFSWSPEDLIKLFTGKRDDRFRAELLAGYAQVLGREPTEEEGETLFQGMLEARRANRHMMRVVEGAVDSVRLVADSPLRVAIASSSRQLYLDSKIDRFGFAPFVRPHVYSAEHVAHGKPAPDIFLFASDKVEVSPDRCLVIEDSPFGVEAGVAAEMEVWGFVGGGHCLNDHDDRLSSAGASRIVKDHAALQQDLIRVIAERS